MNFYEAFFSESSWLTVIVRAENAERAAALALEVVRKYQPDDSVEAIELLDPDGPEGPVVVDDS